MIITFLLYHALCPFSLFFGLCLHDHVLGPSPWNGYACAYDHGLFLYHVPCLCRELVHAHLAQLPQCLDPSP